jgi:carboxypeptidase family protein
MRRFLVALAFAFSCFWLAGNALAQVQITSGSIQGTVVDENGGAVVDAGVEALNLDTNLLKNVMTDSDGRFVFLSLPPGRYTIIVSKTGFATISQTGVTLTVGQSLVLPVTMRVSATQEKIEVSATVDAVDTVSTAASSTLDETAVSETPILGRKFEDLLTLTPGVSIVQGPDGDEINFNGQRGIFNNISLDGGDYNNGFFGEQMGGQRAAIDITLDAVKEFQVVASGANAEFGRTAGGVVNVITKSGTNDVHGSVFYYQRLEALTSATSDGKPLDGFKREQFGGTMGGPIKKDKLFFFGSGEGVREDLTRTNLSVPIGTPCVVANPVFHSNITEAQISASGDCQRLVLLNFMKTNFNEDDSLPVSHQVRNAAAFGRADYNLTASNQISASYNFDWSKNPNQTFDVPTFGTTANGIEGPSKIQAINTNWFATVSPSKLNEAHFTYSRENRPRLAANPSSVPDTGIGFGPSFRFGQPFFLEPGVDEIFWHTDARDNFSIIHGAHTIKFGGEWLHSVNTQVFRGFFNGRYIFDSPVGFLRYASPSSLGTGYGPTTEECKSGAFTDQSLLTRPVDPVTGKATATCPDGSLATGGPLLFYLQHGPTQMGESKDQSGFSSIANNEYALFLQDTWKVTKNLTLNYGLRWEAQIFPDPTLAPTKTAYGTNLPNPLFPSTGYLPNQKKMFQPRVGFAWDIRGNGKSALRASWGIFNARQNMLTQVGAVTTNGVQQQSLFASSCVDSPKCDLFNPATGGAAPTYPTTITPPILQPNKFPFQPGVTVFSKNYANPRIYAVNVALEQQLMQNMSAYVDFDWSMGVHLTRFEDPNSALSGFTIPANADTVTYTGSAPFPNLGSITNTTSDARSLYRGVTFGVKEHLSPKFQMEANYTYSRDYDDDSNERDPFSFRYANFYNLAAEYAPSDRDERHRFNFYTYGKLPGGFTGDIRMQAHSAQPVTDNFVATPSGSPCSITNSKTRFVNGVDCGRNHLRKDNAYFSFDFAIARPFQIGERMRVIPKVELFNLFNNKNNVVAASAPLPFNFDGFLRQGVGDPRQAQLSARFEF